MSDGYILTKSGKRYRRDRASVRINENEVQDMYEYCIQHGKNPTDQFEKGVRVTFLELKQAENAAKGISPCDSSRVGPVNISVGGKEMAAPAGSS